MSRNWLRRIIIKGPTTFTGGRDGELTINFAVQMWHSGSPNQAQIRVINPSPKSVGAWKGAEGQPVSIMAGYEDTQGVIFSGEIRQVFYAHESAADSYLQIFAADGDQQYRKAIVTKTLAKGWTPMDKVNVALDFMKPFGITMGINTLDLSRPVYPRGIGMVGLARQHLREVTLSAGGLWSIQMGKLMMTPANLDNGNPNTIKLNAQTGLVGYPRVTRDGVEFTSLINPALNPLQKVEIDPSLIVEAEKDNNPFSAGQFDINQALSDIKMSAGVYTIYKMDRYGSTRGPEFYDQCVAIGQGGFIPSYVQKAEPGYIGPSLGSQ